MDGGMEAIEATVAQTLRFRHQIALSIVRIVISFLHRKQLPLLAQPLYPDASRFVNTLFSYCLCAPYLQFHRKLIQR